MGDDRASTLTDRLNGFLCHWRYSLGCGCSIPRLQNGSRWGRARTGASTADQTPRPAAAAKFEFQPGWASQDTGRIDPDQKQKPYLFEAFKWEAKQFVRSCPARLC